MGKFLIPENLPSQGIEKGRIQFYKNVQGIGLINYYTF